VFENPQRVVVSAEEEEEEEEEDLIFVYISTNKFSCHPSMVQTNYFLVV
jgi:hypothetical protein